MMREVARPSCASPLLGWCHGEDVALRFTNVIQLKYERAALTPCRYGICVYCGLAEEAEEGAWRMPWLTEAMKDVTSCDKPRLGANGL